MTVGIIITWVEAGQIVGVLGATPQLQICVMTDEQAGAGGGGHGVGTGLHDGLQELAMISKPKPTPSLTACCFRIGSELPFAHHGRTSAIQQASFHPPRHPGLGAEVGAQDDFFI
jgi:hypothetical protein